MLRALTLSLLPLALAMDLNKNEDNNLKTDLKFELDNNDENLTNELNDTPKFLDNNDLNNNADETKIHLETNLLAKKLSDKAKKIETEWDYFCTFWNTLWWLGGMPIMYIGVDSLINLAFGLGNPSSWIMWTLYDCKGEGDTSSCEYSINDFVLAITCIWGGFTIIELIVLAIACNSKQKNTHGDNLQPLCCCYPELWIGRCVTPLACIPCLSPCQRDTLFGGAGRKKVVLETLVKNGAEAARQNEWKVIATTFACFWWLAVIPLIGTLWAWCNAEEHGHTAWLAGDVFFAKDAHGNEVPSPFIWILLVLWSIGTTIACTVLGQSFHQKNNGTKSKFLCWEYNAQEMMMRIGNYWACGSWDMLHLKLFPTKNQEEESEGKAGGIFCCCFSCGFK